MARKVSVVTLVNSAVALPGKLHHIDWPAARAVLAGVVPSIVAGVLLLDYLSSTAASLLQFLLGAVIIYSGVVFALRWRRMPAAVEEVAVSVRPDDLQSRDVLAIDRVERRVTPTARRTLGVRPVGDLRGMRRRCGEEKRGRESAGELASPARAPGALLGRAHATRSGSQGFGP